MKKKILAEIDRRIKYLHHLYGIKKKQIKDVHVSEVDYKSKKDFVSYLHGCLCELKSFKKFINK